jgi:hypothetical protein
VGYRGSDDRATVTTSDKSEGLVKKSVSYRIEFFFCFVLFCFEEAC